MLENLLGQIKFYLIVLNNLLNYPQEKENIRLIYEAIDKYVKFVDGVDPEPYREQLCDDIYWDMKNLGIPMNILTIDQFVAETVWEVFHGEEE